MDQAADAQDLLEGLPPIGLPHSLKGSAVEVGDAEAPFLLGLGVRRRPLGVQVESGHAPVDKDTLAREELLSQGFSGAKRMIPSWIIADTNNRSAISATRKQNGSIVPMI